MTIEKILPKFDKLKKTGRASWRAICPACGGKNGQKLALKEIDGKVLIKCFGGCSADQIASAGGFELSDLFPKSEGGRPIRCTFTREVAANLRDELAVAWILMQDIAAGRKLSDTDRARAARCAKAAARLLREVT